MKHNLIIKIIKSSLSIIIFFLFFTHFVIGQNGQKINNNYSVNTKVEEIITKARLSISKSIKLEDIKSIHLEFTSTKETKSKNGELNHFESNTKLSFSFPDKIRLEIYNNFANNEQFLTKVLNSSRFSTSSELLVDGKPFNAYLPKPTFDITKEQQITNFKWNIFNIVFPLLIQSDWYQNLEFRFIGKAKLADGNAVILESIDKNNTKFQIFFDEQSNLPVVIIEKFVDFFTKQEIERKRYFSEFKEEKGILIAHKILIEQNGKLVEEQKFKNIQINPKFKSNLFSLKTN